MRKNLTILIALLVAIAVAAPAMAAVEFKYGGQFRARWISGNNIVDGTDDDTNFTSAGGNGNDHTNFADQRLRLYFTFQSSENLKLVVKLEMGDIAWGDEGSVGRTGPSRGGQIGADGVNVELKNAYVDFAIPCTPTRALIGIQGLSLLDSWIIDDDFAAAVLVTKLDPFKITLGYVAGQNNGNGRDLMYQRTDIFNRESENIDDFFLAIDWAMKPFKASLIGFYQYAHKTPATMHPGTMNTPVSIIPALSLRNQDFVNGVFTAYQTNNAAGQPFDWFGHNLLLVRDNQFFDLGFNFTYQVEYLKAYVNFVKNFGSVDTIIERDAIALQAPFDSERAWQSHDYTGWMVDAGVFYY